MNCPSLFLIVSGSSTVIHEWHQCNHPTTDIISMINDLFVR